MAQQEIPTLGFGKRSRQRLGPDPNLHAEYYSNIVARRFMAWLLDTILITSIMAAVFVVLLITKVVTFGLMSIPLYFGFFLVPLIYYSVFLAGELAATPAMRVVGLELKTWNDGRPDYAQVVLRTIVHYLSVLFLSPLVLLVMLFNQRRLALHDYLSGTVMVNRLAAAATAPIDPRHSQRPPPIKR